ncbi:unnamed protein product [Darwinula stevensoni]|uniref:MMS22-like C-terminal domain-containing protein n=1 Tax=Darwinula stevensoni TaxID=69355 RepID=A0A7R8X5G9_9CRUS|nr:unnamed protein product [Darwinula stevensoni]CAG0880420.1 unnamed protein product [Darwinula stevensoni]
MAFCLECSEADVDMLLYLKETRGSERTGTLLNLLAILSRFRCVYNDWISASQDGAFLFSLEEAELHQQYMRFHQVLWEKVYRSTEFLVHEPGAPETLGDLGANFTILLFEYQGEQPKDLDLNTLTVFHRFSGVMPVSTVPYHVAVRYLNVLLEESFLAKIQDGEAESYERLIVQAWLRALIFHSPRDGVVAQSLEDLTHRLFSQLPSLHGNILQLSDLQEQDWIAFLVALGYGYQIYETEGEQVHYKALVLSYLGPLDKHLRIRVHSPDLDWAQVHHVLSQLVFSCGPLIYDADKDCLLSSLSALVILPPSVYDLARPLALPVLEALRTHLAMECLLEEEGLQEYLNTAILETHLSQKDKHPIISGSSSLSSALRPTVEPLSQALNFLHESLESYKGELKWRSITKAAGVLASPLLLLLVYTENLPLKRVANVIVQMFLTAATPSSPLFQTMRDIVLKVTQCHLGFRTDGTFRLLEVLCCVHPTLMTSVFPQISIIISELEEKRQVKQDRVLREGEAKLKTALQRNT